MGKEIDLLIKYPKTKRDFAKRLERKTEEVRSIARRFDKEFFKDKKLTIVNNTEKEIFLCTKEMEMKFNNSEYNNSKIKNIHKSFWKVFEKENYKKALYLKDKLRIKINTNFLINNPNLL